MKTCKQILFTLTLVAGLCLVQGCALLLVGGVAAGAAYGTVKYASNTLQVTQNVSLDKAWKAAKGALAGLQIPVTSSVKDGASGRLQGLSAKKQPVIIQLTRKGDTLTNIQISVGTFDSEDNRIAAQQIYDRMTAAM